MIKTNNKDESLHGDLNPIRGRHPRESGDLGKNWIPGQARNDVCNKIHVVVCKSSQIFSLICGCFFFTFSGAVPPALAQVDLPDLIKKAEPSIVVVLTFDQKGKRLGQGTGFFISKNGDVISNHHVLQGASRSIIKLSNGEEYAVKGVAAEDPEGDLVRISMDIPQEKIIPLSVSPAIPRVGEKVVVIGSPLGLDQTVSDGIVSAIREVPGCLI